MNAELLLDERLNAVRTGLTTTLDLSGLGLLTIPDSVFAVARIRTLIVATPKPLYPDELRLLAQMEQRLSDAINLPGWNVRRRWESKRAFQWLADQPASPLDERLRDLPDAIAQLEALEVLDLSYQSLTQLPDALCTLPRLRKLRLTGNPLTHLPAAFAHLTTLELLDVRGTSLPEWPGFSWPDGFDAMPLHDFNTQRDDAIRQKNRLVKAGDIEQAAAARAEELRWGLHR